MKRFPFCLVATLLCLVATASGAQVATAVVAVQGLDFGSLVAGLAEPVRLSEGWRRAEARIEGEKVVDVRLILPTALVAASGASIPLQFAGGDASFTMVGTNQTKLFDPNAGTKIQFKTGGSAAMLHLGGTALPAATQQAGSYSATIVIVLSKPGQ